MKLSKLDKKIEKELRRMDKKLSSEIKIDVCTKEDKWTIQLNYLNGGKWLCLHPFSLDEDTLSKRVDFWVNKMIEILRQSENLLLESNTSMAEHTNKKRKKFYNQAMALKKQGGQIYNFLVNKFKVNEETLNEFLSNEGI